jgi:soluble lytic murein transglycosylase-like protein
LLVLIDKNGMAFVLLVMLALLPLAAGAQVAADRQVAAAARVQTSIDRQAASIRKQSGAGADRGGFFLLGPWQPRVRTTPRPVITGDCSRVAEDELKAIVSQASTEHGVDANLIRAVIEQESGGRPCAVSPKGAQGMMQLMPAAQADLGLANPIDPTENVRAGSRYLRQMLDKYRNNVPLALAAYNAGPGRVDEKGGIPNIPETEDYVSDIMEQLRTASVQ